MKSSEYRAFVRNCLAMVETLVSEGAKSSMILMAEFWHRLAREAEEAERPDVVRAPEQAESEASGSSQENFVGGQNCRQ
jgi:hypothetical protein